MYGPDYVCKTTRAIPGLKTNNHTNSFTFKHSYQTKMLSSFICLQWLFPGKGNMCFKKTIFFLVILMFYLAAKFEFSTITILLRHPHPKLRDARTVIYSWTRQTLHRLSLLWPIYIYIYIWHMTYDTWHLTCDTWHLTPDTWHVTCGGGEHSFKISSSYF